MIAGAKGGGSQRTPVESPDSLRSIAYFRILDAISEGEIGGLVNGLQSIYLDETPLANTDGSLNFQGVHVEQRTGSQDQDYIPGYAAVENEISVGVELKQVTPWVRSLTNVQLSAVRITISVPALSKANTSNGDINGYSVAYKIEVQTDGGTYQLAYQGAITGKTTTKYQRSHRIDLPSATAGWNVRVTRTTPNANSSSIADITTIDSYTEVIDAKLRYPNTALVAISGDASQFSNIPSRGYDMWGRIIQVPSNYDPGTRSYIGVWDGSFKPAWTDNPAWIYYDLATHPRYGLGHLIDASQVNKWDLYRIAQYCDQLVPDGKGGQEPRFTCNVFLQSQSDAYKLLSDLASIFRGMSFWTGGAIGVSADIPTDPDYVYSAANVIDGKFTYSASARKTRYTVVQVTWNDPIDFYRAKVETVQNDAGMARYGLQATSITAFGCTSQGQAQRAGQWLLLTSQMETDTVTFKVGLDGAVAAPGQIIRLQDPARAGKRQAGRISIATKSVVTVDRAPDAVVVGDSLTVMLPSGVSETRTVNGIDGRNLTVSPMFSELPEPEAVWTVESATLVNQLFRVISVTEDKSSADLAFSVTAAQHYPGKFDAIDHGTIIQPPPISELPSSLQAPPTDVVLSSHVVTMQGIATNVMTISWAPASGAAFYQVEWRKDDGEWVSAGRVSGQSADVQGIYTGQYLARVRAISAGGIVSLPALSALTDVLGKTGAPPTVTTLTATSKVWGIHLQWGFPAGAEDTQRTEIWRSNTPNLEAATKMADLAYPQNTLEMDGLAAGASFYFWARLVDRTGNIGAFYPTGAGVNGQASSDPADYEPILVGLIEDTQLGQDILGAVDQMTPDMAGEADLFSGDDTRFAGVWTQLSAQQEGDMAAASKIDTVQATVDDNTALVQQASQTVVDLNGKISATWTVRCQVTADGRIYGAGMGLGVEQQADGTYQSQFLVQADRFAVLNVANGASTAPFVIQGGQVFISQALIGTGWITNAMIGNQIASTAQNNGGQPVWEINKNGTRYVRGNQFTITEDVNGWRMSNGSFNVIEIGVLS